MLRRVKPAHGLSDAAAPTVAGANCQSVGRALTDDDADAGDLVGWKNLAIPMPTQIIVDKGI